MFQSFSRNNPGQTLPLKCQKCKKKPNDQFVLLLCDHVVCAPCLQLYLELRDSEVEGVRCPCGVVSYFRDGQVEGEEDGEGERRKSRRNVVVNIHETSVRGREGSNKRASSRPSVGLIQSKNTTSTKNLSRINTQFLGFTQSRRNQPQQTFMLQQSKYPVQPLPTPNHHRESGLHFGAITPPVTGKKERLATQTHKMHYEPQYIDSETVTDNQWDREREKEKENLEPNLKGRGRKVYGWTEQLEREASSEEEQEQSPQFQEKGQSKPKKASRSKLSSQLKSQLDYLRLTHKKHLGSLQRAYQQAREKIDSDYSRLENNLKDLCLETLVLDRKQSRVNLGKIIGMRYQTYVGNSVEKLTEQIRGYALQGEELGLGLEREQTQRNARFTSPQPYRSQHLETQPASIYTSKPVYEPTIHRHQHFYSKPNQNDSKLQKRTKRKTNIIIEL